MSICWKQSDSYQIIDNGQGIPEQEIDDIFRPFKNECTLLPAVESGHGLGLAIVKKIIEGHKGYGRFECGGHRFQLLFYTTNINNRINNEWKVENNYFCKNTIHI